jgi:hypothetical protein
MNRFLLVTSLFVVAGCATPAAEPSQSESFQATESGSNELLEHNNPVAGFEGAEVVAGNHEGAEGVAEKFEGIEDVEAPSVSKNPAEMVQQTQMAEPEVVCERVVPTGSSLSVRVCRRTADIERNQREDQKLFDDIKRNSNIGTSRL